MTRELNVKLETARSIIRLLVREDRVERKPVDGLIRQKTTPETKETILELVLQTSSSFLNL